VSLHMDASPIPLVGMIMMEEQLQKNSALKANGDTGVPVGMPKKTPAGLTISYSLRYNRCGNRGCSCHRKGIRHGPYWYAYFYEQEKYISCYIGSLLTPAIARERINAKIERLKRRSPV
jgi:hypothetical protein